MSFEQNLLAIRDAAHLNSLAFGDMVDEAQLQYDTVRTEWTDSGTRRDMLTQLATVIAAYKNAQREAGELRDEAIAALETITATPPPLPTPVVAGVPQFIQIIGESTPGLLPPAAEFGRYLATLSLTLLGTPETAVIAAVAPTNEAILPLYVGGVLFARATFPAGVSTANIEILQSAIAAPALVIFETPAVQDPTLSGVTATWTARRNVGG